MSTNGLVTHNGVCGYTRSGPDPCPLGVLSLFPPLPKVNARVAYSFTLKISISLERIASLEDNETDHLLAEVNEEELGTIKESQPGRRLGPRTPSKLLCSNPLMVRRGWHPSTRAAGNHEGGRTFARGPLLIFQMCHYVCMEVCGLVCKQLVNSSLQGNIAIFVHLQQSDMIIMQLN